MKINKINDKNFKEQKIKEKFIHNILNEIFFISQNDPYFKYDHEKLKDIDEKIKKLEEKEKELNLLLDKSQTIEDSMNTKLAIIHRESLKKRVSLLEILGGKK